MTVASMPRSAGRSRVTRRREREDARVERGGNFLLDTVMPWTISITFHVGLALVAVFIWYLANEELAKDRVSIVVPNAFEDPAYSEHPGGNTNPGAGDPTREAAQDRLKQAFKTEGWAESRDIQDVSALLGNGGANEAMGIFAGSGASVGVGKNGNSTDGGTVSAYGMPGGAGNGPRSSFYGTGGNATKIVYILDHSGSMLDNFDFLKMQAAKSVNNLVPVQYFAVILVSDQAKVMGDGALRQALPEAKKQFADAIKLERAEGANDNLLAPFEQAFNKAFAMNPELIYFLTDGKFGDGLIFKVNQMNRERRVHINTIAFVTEEPGYKQQLEQLAKENGGTYKFIPEKDLAK